MAQRIMKGRSLSDVFDRGTWQRFSSCCGSIKKKCDSADIL